MESFSAGTLAGAGSFHCERCGYAVALHELDQIPACPNCGGADFRRSSIFADHPTELATTGEPPEGQPDWLEGARDALVQPGAYVAYDDGERPRVVPLQDGWTRVGRSLSAHLRFDDPTVSRRHALIHREDDGVRILDDRSLNGIFVNGEPVEWQELADGDEVRVGRFRLFVICLGSDATRDEPKQVAASAS